MKTMKTMFSLMDVNWNDNNYDDKYPYQIILNIYESNLSPDVIASQLDVSQDDIINTIKNIQSDNKNKEKSIIDASSSPKHEMINSISNFDVEKSMKDIQKKNMD